MSRQPNNEQMLAIKKSNGVILSAGAGSGKTFVIVEHLILLISEYEKASKEIMTDEVIGHYLGKIVLMTFTKKASGEMLIRLIKRLEELAIEDSNNIFWKLVLKNVNRIQISTIHGFCHMLIKSGYWNYLPTTVEILDDFSLKEKIKYLFDLWLEENRPRLNTVFLAHISDLLSSIEDIFSSPELRYTWKEGEKLKSNKIEIDEYFNDLLILKNFKYIFSDLSISSNDVEKLKKPGFSLIAMFEDLFRSEGIINFENFEKYIELFESFKSFPRETKDMDQVEKVYRLEIKELHEALKKTKIDLCALIENFESFKEWENNLLSAFNFIDKKYLTVPGLSYSDLEYYAHQGLNNKEVQDKVSKRFNYFIVDEFQDTSFVQFDILKMCIKNDLSKLFCVGDKKQAIYGFRGGELKVFEDCSKLQGESANLFLKNNYRSSREVVDFNNEFFSHVLPSGNEYQNLDSHVVEMEEQATPSDAMSGVVTKYIASFNDDEGSNTDIDLIESRAIFKIINEQIEIEDIKSIAILYRKLKPSHYLIDQLRTSSLAFSAQIKIKYDDDPLISLFEIFVRFLLNDKDPKKQKSGQLLADGLIKIMGIDSISILEIESFSSNSKILGISSAFWQSVYKLGISNSHYVENGKLIDAICLIGENNPLKILDMIGQQSGDYSFEMVTGIKKKIVILSAHASKGLEYDSVILGGTHKNGRYEGLKAKVGKFPKSFKWKTTFSQKNYYKSPNYHLEGEIIANKNFSEGKRLLYVACTRAIAKLSYVSVEINQKEALYNKNSWINAFRVFNVGSVVQKNFLIENTGDKFLNTTMLLKDNMGILPIKHSGAVGITSELSVTRLASLAECPFKFYLKNVCKIEVDNKLKVLSADEEEEIFYSSKKRGIEIHSILSKLLKNEMQLSTVKEKYTDCANWVTSLVSKSQMSRIISEVEFKFSFFGQMISAVPDLILQTADKYEIWDFKTGLRSEEEENSYWFQLMAYAYGFSLTNVSGKDDLFELKLVYLDQKSVISKTLKLKDIINNLFTTWKKTENLYQVNNNHCKNCEYSIICTQGSKSSTSIASI